MESAKLKNILEAVLLGTDRVLTVAQLEALFELDDDRPTRDEIRKALLEMEEEYASRSYELKQVASGYRLQVRQDYADWVGRLWEEKPARYTRALLETLALIAYRQPITRGEIEEVRGVSVSSNIIKTLLEREWIKVLGHKDVPGKPSLYGTTKEFLDYFNLKSLDQLPTLAEIKDLDSIHPELALDENNMDENNIDQSAAANTGDGTMEGSQVQDVSDPDTVDQATADDETAAQHVDESAEAADLADDDRVDATDEVAEDDMEAEDERTAFHV
jgi:segregation and condensation protein B